MLVLSVQARAAPRPRSVAAHQRPRMALRYVMEHSPFLLPSFFSLEPGQSAPILFVQRELGFNDARRGARRPVPFEVQAEDRARYSVAVGHPLPLRALVDGPGRRGALPETLAWRGKAPRHSFLSAWLDLATIFAATLCVSECQLRFGPVAWFLVLKVFPHTSVVWPCPCDRISTPSSVTGSTSRTERCKSCRYSVQFPMRTTLRSWTPSSAILTAQEWRVPSSEQLTRSLRR